VVWRWLLWAVARGIGLRLARASVGASLVLLTIR
jgi:hypothetical protein